MEKIFRYTVYIMLIFNILAFLLYGRDKRLAKKQKWRISEKVLLSLSFFGGALGALLGMHVFRHKTKHWYFYAVGMIGLLWQSALLIYLRVNGGIL